MENACRKKASPPQATSKNVAHNDMISSQLKFDLLLYFADPRVRNMHILVTGAAGFIGFHLVRRLLNRGDTVVGLDNLNNYYDVRLKRGRLTLLEQDKNFSFIEANLEDSNSIQNVFDQHAFDRVVNLAAQAGVRYSLENPRAYIDANIVGFLNILENCRHNEVPHLVYASSSSVSGANTKMPFSVHHNVDHPVSLYAVSKKSN